MARREPEDPFAVTSNEPLRVAEGLFRSTGPDLGRTGATNARAGSAWRGASQRRRVNVIVTVALIAVVLVLLPVLISVVGTMRRDALAAQAESNERQPVSIVVIRPEVEQAAHISNPALGGYAIASSFVPSSVAQQLRDRLDAVDASLSQNDAAATEQLANDANSFFVSTFAPALSAATPKLIDEWSAMTWRTRGDVEDALAALQAALPAGQAEAISKAVVNLSTLLGNARDEHFKNRVTYFPPAPPAPAAPEPSTSTSPTSTAEPTTAPDSEQPKQETPAPDQPQQPPAKPEPQESEPQQPTSAPVEPEPPVQPEPPVEPPAEPPLQLRAPEPTTATSN